LAIDEFIVEVLDDGNGSSVDLAARLLDVGFSLNRGHCCIRLASVS
jgi:hypothetical protein